MADLKALADAVIKGDQNTAAQITKAALDEGISAETTLNKGLIAAMDIVGDRFSKNEIYIPEILMAAWAMKSAMESTKSPSIVLNWDQSNPMLLI